MSETKSQTKLFIANLPWALRGKDLKDIFSEYGEVAYAKVILDRETGKSKWQTATVRFACLLAERATTVNCWI